MVAHRAPGFSRPPTVISLDGERVNDVAQLLDMLIHIANQNAREAREAEQRAGIVTAADLEAQEWEAFKAKIQQQRRLLGLSGVRGASEDGIDVDEDDVDMLLSLIGGLERGAPGHPTTGLTVTEIVRVLQNDGVLSVEFPAAARSQAKRLLGKLREVNRVWQDAHGRWALLRSKS